MATRRNILSATPRALSVLRRPKPFVCEALEDRRLLAVDIQVLDARGELLITGDARRDEVAVHTVGADLLIVVKSGRASTSDVREAKTIRRITFRGWGGDDVFENNTSIPSTLRGGAGDDHLIGGSGSDLLIGNSGGDHLEGRGDSDKLHGGHGDDVVDGGDGDDAVHGESGSDEMFGGDGNDRMHGGLGNDLIDAGGGNDTVGGAEGQDVIRGGLGHDSIHAGSAADIVLGGDGDDTLFGFAGGDILLGGDGSDEIIGGSGGDLLIGGSTNHDRSDAALREISDVWTSADPYEERVSELRDARFPFQLDPEVSTLDDLLVDTVSGGAGQDWLFLPGEFDEVSSALSPVEYYLRLDQLNDVAANESVASRIPHANDASMRREHFALFDLVKYSDATHTAVRSGNWSDATIWQDGQAPVDGANTLIPPGVHVTVDTTLDQRLRTVRVDGGLHFAPDRDTRLMVDTLVVNVGGQFHMGTANRPIGTEVSSEIVIVDNGPIDRTWDPLGLSRGVIVHGRATIYGAEKTSFMPLAAAPRRGAEWLALEEVPNNWNVGDQLVLAGTRRGTNQDEEREILAIDGPLVRVDPLRYSHSVPDERFDVHVANVTRNVRIVSENTADERGHLMFMHTDNVDVNYLGTYHLGRTDKTEPANDSVIDTQFRLMPETGTNQRGRYAMHFHRTGTDSDQDAAARVHGSAVVDSRGWGFVNHSSHVNFTLNVAYDVDGAGFVTEAGDEIGSFVENFAIHSTGSGEGIESRNEIQDFGHQGDGFWLQGGGVSVVDNVAAGQAKHGFVFFTRGLRPEKEMPRTQFSSDNLVDASISQGRATISVGSVPIQNFRGNQAYSSQTGTATRFHQLNSNHDEVSVIEDLLLWNNQRGLNIPYTNQLVIRNVEIYGSENSPSGIGIDRNSVTRNIAYEDLVVQGFREGIRVPERGKNVILSGQLNNIDNIVIESARRAGRSVRISSDVEFQTPSVSRDSHTVVMEAEIREHDDSVNHLFYEDTVLWETEDGLRRLYFREQAADFVPFRRSSEFVPEAYVGKTNQELMNEFGLALAGQVSPSDATTIDGVVGLATNVE